MHICLYVGKKQLIFSPWPNLSVCAKVRQMAQFHKPTNQCAQHTAWLIFQIRTFSLSCVSIQRGRGFSTVAIQSFIVRLYYKSYFLFATTEYTASAEGPHLPIVGPSSTFGGDLTLG